MITVKELIDYATSGLVFASGGLAGHYASVGMSAIQWAGAAVAVLGSITVAVAVRVWDPKTEAAKARQRD